MKFVIDRLLIVSKCFCILYLLLFFVWVTESMQINRWPRALWLTQSHLAILLRVRLDKQALLRVNRRLTCLGSDHFSLENSQRENTQVDWPCQGPLKYMRRDGAACLWIRSHCKAIVIFNFLACSQWRWSQSWRRIGLESQVRLSTRIADQF